MLKSCEELLSKELVRGPKNCSLPDGTQISVSTVVDDEFLNLKLLGRRWRG